MLNSLRGACSSDFEPRKQNRRIERISTTRKLKQRKYRSRRMRSTRVRNTRRKKREARGAFITYSLRDIIRVILSRRMKLAGNATYFGRTSREQKL